MGRIGTRASAPNPGDMMGLVFSPTNSHEFRIAGKGGTGARHSENVSRCSTAKLGYIVYKLTAPSNVYKVSIGLRDGKNHRSKVEQDSLHVAGRNTERKDHR